ncbi:MAG: TOBE domain-containing protein [Chloroflexi bacterium]|nr:TOBE domain-containing protein [Chloroflexota bacterium]
MVQPGGLFTELGLLPLDTGLPNGTRLEVLLRPEMLTVEEDPDSATMVESIQFRGADVVCVLRLPSGRLIRALRPAAMMLRRGTKVRASGASSHFVAFLREQAIPLAMSERRPSPLL